MRANKLFFLTVIFLVTGCIGSNKLGIEKILEYSGINKLPEKEEFKQAGAVILYENTKTQFFLDGSWDLQRRQTYHLVFRYFNDKAENWLTRTIYLDNDRFLINFYARTIKSDG